MALNSSPHPFCFLFSHFLPIDLFGHPGVPGSDYINGNYIDGYRRQNAYIATQGSLPETFGDFWRMVWEQHTANIIMMTKLEEKSRVRSGGTGTTRKNPEQRERGSRGGSALLMAMDVYTVNNHGKGVIISYLWAHSLHMAVDHFCGFQNPACF